GVTGRIPSADCEIPTPARKGIVCLRRSRRRPSYQRDERVSMASRCGSRDDRTNSFWTDHCRRQLRHHRPSQILLPGGTRFLATNIAGRWLPCDYVLNSEIPSQISCTATARIKKPKMRLIDPAAFGP